MADQAGSLCDFVGLASQSNTALGSMVSLAGFIHAVASGSWVRASRGEPGQGSLLQTGCSVVWGLRS